jgi:5-methyltetrahydrofolate--homocysteine methyltransferase
MTDLTRLSEAIERGDQGTARSLAEEALVEGIEPSLVLDAMTSAMESIGASFQRGETYVSGMLISARAMKEAMAVLEPALVSSGLRPEHTVVIGTVAGDLHDIGKGLVAMMWKGANLNVVDIGTNVSPERFVEAARDSGAAAIGLSALLTTTMTAMADVVAAVRASDISEVKVIVGGAPVTAEYAASIGADAFAPDASVAVDVIKQQLALA